MIFNKIDIITSFDDLTEKRSLSGYPYHKSNNVVVFYKIVFQTDGFPIIEKAIKFDVNLKSTAKFKRKAGSFTNVVCLRTKYKTGQVFIFNQFPNYLKPFHKKKERL